MSSATTLLVLPLAQVRAFSSANSSKRSAMASFNLKKTGQMYHSRTKMVVYFITPHSIRIRTNWWCISGASHDGYSRSRFQNLCSNRRCLSTTLRLQQIYANMRVKTWRIGAWFMIWRWQLVSWIRCSPINYFCARKTFERWGTVKCSPACGDY